MARTLGRFTLDGQARLEGRPASLGTIPDGVAGVRFSAKVMVGIVKAYRAHPKIRETAVNWTRNLPNRDWWHEAESLFEGVRENVRYVFDPVDVEYIMTPDCLLATGAGDCDDMSVLLASLLESIGHPARFCVVGFEGPNEYEHVYVETKIGERWIPADATQDFPFGWAPPDPCAIMRFYV